MGLPTQSTNLTSWQISCHIFITALYHSIFIATPRFSGLARFSRVGRLPHHRLVGSTGAVLWLATVLTDPGAALTHSGVQIILFYPLYWARCRRSIPRCDVWIFLFSVSLNAELFRGRHDTNRSYPHLSFVLFILRNERIMAEPTRLRQISERIPAGRWGKPEDFAGPAVFLASTASSYVTGETLVVDGGWMAR